MIKLTATEISLGAHIGVRRNIESVLSGRGDTVGNADDTWSSNIDGALAEVAVAKHLNLWLDPNLGKFGDADVGEWHIRATKYKKGHLHLKPQDKSGKYLLVIGTFDTWRIAGWIDAEQARQEKYFRVMKKERPTPCYWIPQDDLNPLEAR